MFHDCGMIHQLFSHVISLAMYEFRSMITLFWYPSKGIDPNRHLYKSKLVFLDLEENQERPIYRCDVHLPTYQHPIIVKTGTTQIITYHMACLSYKATFRPK